MNIIQVEIIKDDPSYKGTWYKKGDVLFVTRNTQEVFSCGYFAIDKCGGINKSDAKVLTGVLTRIKCLWVWVQVKLKLRPCYSHGII